MEWEWEWESRRNPRDWATLGRAPKVEGRQSGRSRELINQKSQAFHWFYGPPLVSSQSSLSSGSKGLLEQHREVFEKGEGEKKKRNEKIKSKTAAAENGTEGETGPGEQIRGQYSSKSTGSPCLAGY